VRATPPVEPTVETVTELGVEPPPGRRPGRPELRSQLVELEDEVADLRRELERSERRVEAMKQIQQVLGSNLQPEVLLRTLVERTTELLDADRSTLFLVDPNSGELVSKVLQADDEIRELRLPPGVGLAGWVASRGEPVHIRDAYHDERFNPEVDRRSGYRTRCMLVWPVRRPRGEDVIGVIQVLNKKTGPFDTTDERLLEAIASSIGVAVEVMTLYRESVARHDELAATHDKLELLFDVEQAIGQASGLDALMQVILQTALEHLHARAAVLYLVDEADDRIHAAAAAGVYAASLRRRRVQLADPILQKVIGDGALFLAHVPVEAKRGRLKVRRAVAAPVRTRSGEIIGALELLDRRDDRDFTDTDARTVKAVAAQAGRAIHAERTREKRERATRLEAMGKMLSGVVHDLRTPMTLVNGYTQMMVEAESGDERESLARLVNRQVDVMAAMTRELLAFARGERTLLLRKVYVARFVTETMEHLSPDLERAGIRVDVEIEHRGAARFDETKLRRVFHNIARNAAEAMPGGGHFAVNVRLDGDTLELRFTDDGPGIPPELEGRLFEPFSTANKPGGTGLGLAMVKKIAEEHRGTVACESSPAGTRFVFRIPAGV
jgi:signal transduction histidine kinase